jgi:hypothetical protein
MAKQSPVRLQLQYRLPADITRCVGEDCKQRKECMRHLAYFHRGAANPYVSTVASLYDHEAGRCTHLIRKNATVV